MKNVSYKLILLLICIVLLSVATYSIAFAQGKEFATTAKSAVVMEKSSHRVLYGVNTDARLPIASTTKIVTALTAINHTDLNDVVEIPAEACGIEGSSIYLRAGEHLTVRELLYGLMLRSGNDAATAIALHTAGSIDAFAAMMNETAANLGLKNCNFVNPHGLQNDNHYCSANDLAVLTCEALNNSDFCEIVSTKSIRISNEGYDYDRVLVNKNKLLTNYEFADGVKTGYTKKAGRCFVGSATRQGMQVIVVVLNCGPMFEETESLLDAAFANYSLTTVVPANKVCGSIEEKGKKVYYGCPERIRYPLKHGEKATTQIELSEDIKQIKIYVNNNLVYVKQLVKI